MRIPVYDTTICHVPIQPAADRFRSGPDGWLPEPVSRDERGYLVAMRAPGLRVSVDALVDVGMAVDLGYLGLLRPVAWQAHRADRLFPRFVGDLELTQVSAGMSQLTLTGGYEPPVSVVGDAADRVVGRHVAAAVVRDFLLRTAEALAAADSRATRLLGSRHA